MALRQRMPANKCSHDGRLAWKLLHTRVGCSAQLAWRREQHSSLVGRSRRMRDVVRCAVSPVALLPCRAARVMCIKAWQGVDLRHHMPTMQPRPPVGWRTVAQAGLHSFPSLSSHASSTDPFLLRGAGACEVLWSVPCHVGACDVHHSCACIEKSRRGAPGRVLGGVCEALCVLQCCSWFWCWLLPADTDMYLHHNSHTAADSV